MWGLAWVERETGRERSARNSKADMETTCFHACILLYIKKKKGEEKKYGLLFNLTLKRISI